MDDEAIIIQIELRQMAQAMAAIRKIGQTIKGMGNSLAQQKAEVRSLDAEWRKLGSTLGRVKMASGGGGGFGGGSRGSGGGGPMSRLSSAQASYSQAMKFGTGTQVFDAQYRLHQAQQAHAKAQNALNTSSPSFMQKIGKVLQSSRIGMGGGLMPLVGQLAAVLGPLGTAAAFAGGAALATGKAMFELAIHAADAGMALAKIGLTAGGTGAQSSQLSVLGNAMGVDMAAMARQFADTISHGGTAAGFAARAGIHDYGTFDTTNKAGKILAWMEQLRRLSPEEAMRQARATGTEALLPSLLLSHKTMANLKADARAKDQITGGSFGKESAEFQTSVGRINDAVGNFMTVIGKPGAKSLTVILNDLAIAVNALAVNTNAMQGDAFKDSREQGGFDVIKGIGEMATNPFQGFMDLWKGIHELIVGDADKKKDALDRNTEAINQNTYAQRNGTFGGGERARGALPSKWSGQWDGLNNQVMTGEAARMGAFNL